MPRSHIVRSCVIPDRPVSIACPPPSSSSYPIAFVASRSGIWKIKLSDDEWLPTSFPSSSNTHAAAGAVAVACSPHHVAAAQQRSVFVWSLDDQTTVLNLSSHKRAVVDVQWNLHDVNVIASGASDGSIALSDIRRPHNVIQSMAASEGMSCLRWHPRASSCHLLASAHGLMVRVWDTRTGKTLSSFTHQSAVNEVRWSPFKGSNEAEELVTSSVQDPRLLFWNTLQERSPARVQGLGAFCRCMTFDWRGEHLVTADDNLTTGSDGQQSCVVRLWSSVKTSEAALFQSHAPDEVQALHSLQPEGSSSNIRVLVAMENGLIQEHTIPTLSSALKRGESSASASGVRGGADVLLPSLAPLHAEGGSQLPAAISHDVATLRRTPRVIVNGLRHIGKAADAAAAEDSYEADDGDHWSLELTLQTLSKVALVNRSIGVDLIVHNSHPAVAPQVVHIDKEGLLPQECVQRLYQMFMETASMAAVTGAQQCLHMCCTMMLQVIDAAIEALDESMMKLSDQCAVFLPSNAPRPPVRPNTLLMTAMRAGADEGQLDTSRSSPLSSSSSTKGNAAEEYSFGPRWCGATFAPNGSLIVFRGPRISSGPAIRSPPPALSSSMRAESDGGILDTPYDTGADDAAADGVFSADKSLLPYFHNSGPRSSGSAEQLSSLASHLHPDSRIPMLLASSLDLFHLDSSSSINACQAEFAYAPEDEDIFFNVSDGSDNGSDDSACAPECGGAADALDVALSAARSRHRRTGSQGADARPAAAGHRPSFSWGQAGPGAADTSFNSAAGGRGLAAVFVSATVDIVPPSSLFPTPSMHLARKYSLDCSDAGRSCAANARVARDRGCLHLERLWGVMGAVATLKQTAKSAIDSLESSQRTDGRRQRQQTKAPAPPTGGFLPSHSAGNNSWDFHPLVGGLMDAVMGRLQQMGDTQTGGSIAALGLCNRSDNGRSGETAGAVLASSYAETLRGWDMPVTRALVAKRAFSWCGMDLLGDLKEGSRSKMFTIGPATAGSDISSVKCSICRLKVMGAAVMCSDCGHAGHPQHVLSWFAAHDVCPAMGCRCTCLGIRQQQQQHQLQQQQHPQQQQQLVESA